MKDTDDNNGLKIIQMACGVANTYFLTNQGIVYATGSNDRWQCSEIKEAKASLDLIDEDYLKPVRMNRAELAERGGEVIPEQAARIIREFQIMQQLEKPYVVPILKKLKQDLQIKQISAGANHVLTVSVNGHCYGWGDNEFG